MLLLSSCGRPAASSTSLENESKSIESGFAGEEVRDRVSRPKENVEVVIDPPYDFDPDEMLPRDFGEHFLAEYDTETTTYILDSNGEFENEVVVLHGEEKGPVIYVVAGVHGNELAGWMTGNLLKKIDIKAGELHILSPANRWGAEADPRTRYVTGEEDLNRSFPGDPEGNMAERVANYIYEDIMRVDPVFVFDLHEAAGLSATTDEVDFLGSSLIYTSLDQMSDLYFNLIQATESGALCSERFGFYAPGPIGSINNTVTTNLGIPVITVETYRAYPMERRISDQLDIVEYVLNYYGMI